MGFEITNEFEEREKLDEGSYPAVCIGIVDMGTQKGGYGDYRAVKLFFFTDEKDSEGNYHIKERQFPAKITPKSALGKAIRKWMKIEIEKGESFDLDQLLNEDCMINIIHSEENDEGNTYDNIASITALSKKMDPVKLPKKIKPFSLYLDKESFDKDVFNDLPDYIKEKIKATKEYKKLMGKKVSDDDDDDDDDDAKSSKKKPSKKKGRDEDDDDEDEKPRRKKKPVDDEEEDEKPRRKKKPVDDEEEEEEDEKPRRKKKPEPEEEEEEDEKPRRRKRPADEEEDEEEDEKPRRRKKPVDEEEEEEEDEKPRRRKR
jgi:hypothetical protein